MFSPPWATVYITEPATKSRDSVLVAKQKKHSEQATLKEKRSKMKGKTGGWTCHMALSGPVSLNEKTKRWKRAKTPKVSEFGAEFSGNKKLENFPSIGRFHLFPSSLPDSAQLRILCTEHSVPLYPPFFSAHTPYCISDAIAFTRLELL